MSGKLFIGCASGPCWLKPLESRLIFLNNPAVSYEPHQIHDEGNVIREREWLFTERHN